MRYQNRGFGIWLASVDVTASAKCVKRAVFSFVFCEARQPEYHRLIETAPRYPGIAALGSISGSCLLRWA